MTASCFEPTLCLYGDIGSKRNYSNLWIGDAWQIPRRKLHKYFEWCAFFHWVMQACWKTSVCDCFMFRTNAVLIWRYREHVKLLKFVDRWCLADTLEKAAQMLRIVCLLPLSNASLLENIRVWLLHTLCLYGDINRNYSNLWIGDAWQIPRRKLHKCYE